MRTATLLALVFLLAACTVQGDPDDSPPASTGHVLVVVEGVPGDDPGLSVAEALAHGPTDDLVTVTGALFVDADGTVRLCDAIAESFPPQCGGARIVVEGLDLDIVRGLQDANGVRWAEGVRLFGSVE
jgi:hypothetical protein